MLLVLSIFFFLCYSFDFFSSSFNFGVNISLSILYVLLAATVVELINFCLSYYFQFPVSYVTIFYLFLNLITKGVNNL